LHSEAADCRTSQGAKLPEEQISLNEAARLFGAAMGCVWDVAHERWKRKLDRRLFRRERWIINRRRPAARFILVGLYSARREETIRRTQWLPTTTHPWINLNAMIYQGRGREEQTTKKRRPPAKIANRLRPHLMRWRAIDAPRSAELHAARLMKEGEEIRFVINRMHDGQPLAGKIRSAWEGILEDAGLGEDVVRHSLRHTAATWQMQAGTDLWEAAGWLGMTVEQLEQNYGHHHPDFQEEAAEAFGGRALDIPSVDDPCSAHSRHVPRSIAGLRSLNAIISTGVPGPPSTSHGPS
jgi:integrase